MLAGLNMMEAKSLLLVISHFLNVSLTKVPPISTKLREDSRRFFVDFGPLHTGSRHMADAFHNEYVCIGDGLHLPTLSRCCTARQNHTEPHRAHRIRIITDISA